MARISSLQPFTGGDFEEFEERLEFYFFANDIGTVAASANAADKLAASKKRKAVLVSLLSAEVYSILGSLCLPAKVADKKLSEICDLLRKYFQPAISQVSATFNFHQLKQKENESTADFIIRLKRLAVRCEFADHLDRALRDQFIAGLSSSSTRNFLLTKEDTSAQSFNDIVKLALTQESAARAAVQLTSQQEVHKVNHRPVESRSQPQSGVSRQSHQSREQRLCYRCGSTQHLADKCKHKATECRHCHRKGHLERVCRQKSTSGASVHNVVTDDAGGQQSADLECMPMFHISDQGELKSKSVPSYKLEIAVNDVPVVMEIDTGSGISIISVHDFESLGVSRTNLTKPSVRMTGFSGAEIKCIGEGKFNVSIDGVEKPTLLRVVDNGGPSLLGRDMLSQFTLPWKQIVNVNHVQMDGRRRALIEEFEELFDTTQVGKLRSAQITLRVDDSDPIFHKARPVPFSITEKYEEALEKLEAEGVIRKVEHSKWASPTVPVLKSDGSIRICADYSRSINAKSDLEHYLLPTIEEMLAKLSGGDKFTKLDLSQAYHQLELDPASRPYTTISTHKGLYEYVRLPFGIHSAVAIFQRTMESILADLPGCIVYVDDILITGKDEDEHHNNLIRVLRRLQEAGMKLNPSKFHFMMDEISYLGHTISSAGVAPTADKIKAMRDAKAPSNVNELQSFIGTANFLRRFIPHFATIMVPLYNLVKKSAEWQWEENEQNAFSRIKAALCSSEVLIHYSSEKDLILQTDASGIGLGAVMFQKDESGELRPVAYGSRVLSSAEKNYSNIEREALALVFGVTNFRQYLLGRTFMLRTDHQPLLKLFGCTEKVPTLVSSRLKKWKMVLSAYNYSMEYIPGRKNVFADYLSRKPMSGDPTRDEMVEQQVLFVQEESEIIRAATVAAETKRDVVLKKVLHFTINGWEEVSEPELFPYFAKRWELSVEDNILLWNGRVVMPDSLRVILLNDLHSEHSGVVRMKRLARRYVWWPKIDEDIESTVKQCALCQLDAKNPPERVCNLDMAGRTVAETASRLCRTVSRQNVPGIGGCVLQVH